MIEKALDDDGESPPGEQDPGGPDADRPGADRPGAERPDADRDEAELGLPAARRLPVDALQPAPAAGADGAEGDPAPADGRPLVLRIEALLFASGQPLGPSRIAHALGVEQSAAQAALAELAGLWRARPGAVDLVEIAGGYRFMTRPEFSADVAALQKKVTVERLSPAALETLAVVAYRQPITRADVEGVRGVAVGPLLRLLLERDLIRITGRSPDPGHPLLYGTTKRFLDHFGLKSLDALPDLKDLLEAP